MVSEAIIPALIFLVVSILLNVFLLIENRKKDRKIEKLIKENEQIQIDVIESRHDQEIW